MDQQLQLNHFLNDINQEKKDKYKELFIKNKKLKINNFFKHVFAEYLFKNLQGDKNWILATGINKNKYEKKISTQNDKINALQIKNVTTAFGSDHFSYIFHRTMNGGNGMSFFEYSLRQTLSSKSFIDLLNEITGLQLTKLNTLFASKYSTGNFLSPHSDKGNGKIAFVINMTKYWKPQYGGNLHFLSDDRRDIIETWVPDFNNFVIFDVPEDTGIPHFVSHVSPAVKYHRYALTGWFE